MIFEILRASDSQRNPPKPVGSAFKDDNGDWKVKLETLDDLMQLVDEAKCGDGLIIDRHRIWIYDDYME